MIVLLFISLVFTGCMSTRQKDAQTVPPSSERHWFPELQGIRRLGENRRHPPVHLRQRRHSCGDPNDTEDAMFAG